MFCAPVFLLILVFFYLSNFVIPGKCLKNFICVDKRYYNEFYGNMIGDMDWTDLVQDRNKC